MSSGLSSLSAMTVEDYVKPYFKNLTDKQLTVIAKITVPVYGLMSVGLSFMIAEIKGIPMSQISTSILSAFGGPTGGLFLYTVFFPWATKRGAIIGTLTAISLTLWISFGKNFSTSLPKTPWAPMPPTDNCPVFQNLTLYDVTMTTTHSTYMNETIFVPKPEGLNKLYSISYQWIGALGSVFCIFIGILTSIIEGLPKSEDVDVRYVLPFFDQFFPFLPERWRKKLYFGVKFEQREELLKFVDKEMKDFEMELLPSKEAETPASALIDETYLTKSQMDRKDQEDNDDEEELADDNDVSPQNKM